MFGSTTSMRILGFLVDQIHFVRTGALHENMPGSRHLPAEHYCCVIQFTAADGTANQVMGTHPESPMHAYMNALANAQRQLERFAVVYHLLEWFYPKAAGNPFDELLSRLVEGRGAGDA